MTSFVMKFCVTAALLVASSEAARPLSATVENSNVDDQIAFTAGHNVSVHYRRELKPGDGWSVGRATWYGGPGGPGPDGMSLYTGSCGYGSDLPNHYVTAWHTLGGYDYGLTDKCGQCYEVMCTHGQTRGPNGKLGPWEGCQEPDGRSVVVMVTDSCPCHHPNAGSNKRWCCGDAEHLDLSYAAFDFIAHRSRGVVDIKYRQVGCDKHGSMNYFEGSPPSGPDNQNQNADDGEKEQWEIEKEKKEEQQKKDEEQKKKDLEQQKRDEEQRKREEEQKRKQEEQKRKQEEQQKKAQAMSGP